MKLCFNELLFALSYTLDCVEHDLLGVTTNHSKRVAYICACMGKEIGFSKEALCDLVGCAILHDNALTEYIQSEYLYTGVLIDTVEDQKLGVHCSLGEHNIKAIPFFGEVKNTVLYHHENADGSGPFHKKAAEIPIYAAFIHIADKLDATYNLSVMDEKKYKEIVTYLFKNETILFAPTELHLFLHIFKNIESFTNLCDFTINQALKEELPYFETEYDPQQLMSISSIFAKITDYKSTFTSLHSIGIARKAYTMASYYHYDKEKCAKLFLAGALHDIGKLAIDINILEKPDKLTEEEFIHMKQHAELTYQVLSQVNGLEEITRWASLHHEKLNGTGYPFGYNAKELGFHERLLACLDIYQALREDRPYKAGKSHFDAMTILHSMEEEGLLDSQIILDIEYVFNTQNRK